MMEMQGNATEIDERNLLQLDALLSHGYGLSPQLVIRAICSPLATAPALR